MQAHLHRISLDSAYRALCSFVVVMSIVGAATRGDAVAVALRGAQWVDAPTDWIAAVGRWVSDHADALGPIGWILLAMGLISCNGRDLEMRAYWTWALGGAALVESGALLGSGVWSWVLVSLSLAFRALWESRSASPVRPAEVVLGGLLAIATLPLLTWALLTTSQGARPPEGSAT